jgi:hypothetical protein
MQNFIMQKVGATLLESQGRLYEAWRSVTTVEHELHRGLTADGLQV